MHETGEYQSRIICGERRVGAIAGALQGVMNMAKRLKNSIGIWGFGPAATRFVPGGYHAETVKEDMVTRTRRVVDGLGNYFDGFEYHYPGEVNEENFHKVRQALGKKDLYCVAVGFHAMDEFHFGSFVNPDAKKRRLAVELAKRAVDIAVAAGGRLIIWPGAEGYNYPFQVDYRQQWDYFIGNVAEVVDYAYQRRVTVFLEHKNSEPAMKIYMRNIGMTIFTIRKIAERGVNTSRLKVNMDWQHLIMNGEPLAEYAALLMKERLLGHHHSNSGWGVFDDDNMTGALNFMEALALAKELQLGGYGKRGERIGFDLFPYTEDPIEAAIQSAKQWQFIWETAEAIDTTALVAARKRKDAIGCYREVYRALGMKSGRRGRR
jgi:xylose isomerase